MTVFRSKAARAIARSRGHMKKAEETYPAQTSTSFSVSKANHALQTGMLDEAARSAEALEIRAIIDFLKADPESHLGELVTSAEAEALENRVVHWLRAAGVEEETIDDD